MPKTYVCKLLKKEHDLFQKNSSQSFAEVAVGFIGPGTIKLAKENQHTLSALTIFLTQS